MGPQTIPQYCICLWFSSWKGLRRHSRVTCTLNFLRFLFSPQSKFTQTLLVQRDSEGSGAWAFVSRALWCVLGYPALASSCSMRHRIPVELVLYLLGSCRCLVSLDHLRWHWMSVLRCLDLFFVYFQLYYFFHMQALETRLCHWKTKGLPWSFFITLLRVTCLCLCFLFVK